MGDYDIIIEFSRIFSCSNFNLVVKPWLYPPDFSRRNLDIGVYIRYYIIIIIGAGSSSRKYSL